MAARGGYKGGLFKYSILIIHECPVETMSHAVRIHANIMGYIIIGYRFMLSNETHKVYSLRILELTLVSITSAAKCLVPPFDVLLRAKHIYCHFTSTRGREVKYIELAAKAFQEGRPKAMCHHLSICVDVDRFGHWSVKYCKQIVRFEFVY